MADYAQPLNKSTVDNIKTSARFDDAIERWIHDSQLWHEGPSGILVPTGDANPLPMKVTGSNVTQNVAITKNGSRLASNPVSGVKTVTGIAAELFAGAARKAGRCEMGIRNLDPAIRLRLGPSTVADTTGWAVEPGAVAIIEFDPASATAIYAISEAGAIQVEVWEA